MSILDMLETSKNNAIDLLSKVSSDLKPQVESLISDLKETIKLVEEGS